jgi:hypothetical protein
MSQSDSESRKGAAGEQLPPVQSAEDVMHEVVQRVKEVSARVGRHEWSRQAFGAKIQDGGVWLMVGAAYERRLAVKDAQVLKISLGHYLLPVDAPRRGGGTIRTIIGFPYEWDDCAARWGQMNTWSRPSR